MNITQRIKYLFGNLCLLVAVCAPVSLCALEKITMEPECVSMKDANNGNGTINLVGANTDVSFTVEFAEPETKYRLYDSGNNEMNTPQTVDLVADTDNPSTYIANTQIYYKSSYKYNDHVVRRFVLQYYDEDSRQWTNVPDVETFEVHNCYVTNEPFNANKDNVSFVVTTTNVCDVTAEQMTKALSATNSLPTVMNVNGSSICYNPYYGTYGSEYYNKNKCVEDYKFQIGDYSGKSLRVIFLDANKNVIDAGSYTYPTLKVQTCPVFTTHIIKADGSTCKAGSSVILAELAKDFNRIEGDNYIFTGCSNSDVTATLQSLASSYAPGSYTATWNVFNYTCQQTFKVESPDIKCNAPNDISLSVTGNCRHVTLTPPSTDGLCGSISVYWSRNQKDSTLVTSSTNSYTDDFYPRNEPYIIYWTVTDGAVAKHCQSTVIVTNKGWSCSDCTVFSTNGQVSIPLPSVPQGCNITRLITSMPNGLTESGDALVGNLAPGSYSISVKEQLDGADLLDSSNNPISCTFNVLVIEKADICK